MTNLYDDLYNATVDVEAIDYFDWEEVEDDEPIEADASAWLFDTLD
jgi:hypothetical protein